VGVNHDEPVDRVGVEGRDARHDQPGVGVEDLQRMWAPWRFGYIAGGAPIEGCPFCVLPARGEEQDATSLILHRGEHSYVIFNAYPYNPGHLMVVPYDHVADLEALEEPVAREVWELGRRSVAVLKTRLRAQGVNLGMNLGAAGGAGIAEHLHLHVVPRWTGDTNFITVVGASRVLPRALEEIYADLAPGFA
jgi:ATP adenylyltransferase